MRQLHVLASGGWGGCERLASALARRVRQEGHEVFVEPSPECRAGLAAEAPDLMGPNLGGRGDSPAPAGLAWQSLHVEPPPPFARAVGLWRWARAARRRLVELAPDVVHVHLSTPAFAAAAALAVAGAPSLWTLHLLPEGRWPLDFMARVPSAWPLRLALRQGARSLVAVSHADAAVLTTMFGAGAVRCVPNAPPPPQEDERTVGPEVWGNAPIKLLSVGRLVPQKGFDRILRALASPRVRALPFRCVVVGDGPERAALERAAAEAELSERLVFLGARPSHAALKQADVLLSGSRYEGLPLVPMEAVLAGSAAIVSPIAPHRELFGHLPDSLLPDDEGGWPAHLEAVLGDGQRLQRLRDGQAQLRERFGPERFYGQYAALYEEVLAWRRGAPR